MATGTIKAVSQSSGDATKVSSSISSVEFSRWAKVGRVCNFVFKFQVSTKIANNTEVLFSGLPAPALPFALPICHDSSNFAGGVIRLRINKNGTMTNGYTSGGIPAKEWEGTATYLTVD